MLAAGAHASHASEMLAAGAHAWAKSLDEAAYVKALAKVHRRSSGAGSHAAAAPTAVDVLLITRRSKG